MENIFYKTSDDIKQHIKKRIQADKVTFLFPTSYISPESAQVGFLLNKLINDSRAKQEQEIYKTFFANSRLEALHGAIKISRHKALTLNPEAKGEILILDKDESLVNYFNPLASEKGKELIPGVTILSSYEDVCNKINQNRYAAVVCRRHNISSLDQIKKLFTLCQDKKIVTVLDESEIDYTKGEIFAKKIKAGVYILGESLTEFQVPFASFSISDSVYEPWNNLEHCLSHSSTYSGNCLALSVVLNCLKKLLTLTKQEQDFLSKIVADKKTRLHTYAKYINPKATFLYKLAGYDFQVTSAKGAYLTTDTGERLLDFAGGGGCNLRGHNPSDVIDEVLDVHDNEHNYWLDLSAKLQQLTGLSHAFPGVSGASVVEIVMILGLLAQAPKSKMLVFKNNYAGKTLLALNGTQQPGVLEPFYPLYYDVMVIDPFADDAGNQVTAALTSGEIALVWFETLSHAEPLPQLIIDLINQYKNDYGYLIGVDEILMGVFRTGKFLQSEGMIKSPDLITLSKNLSDMTFPIAAGLVTSEVYQRAKSKNPEIVNCLSKLYVNQLASHISLHGITKAIENNTATHVEKMGKKLKTAMDEIIDKTPFLKKMHGKGLFQALEVDESSAPVKLVGKDLMKLFISREYYTKCQCVSFFFSHIAPLSVSEEQINEIIRCAKKTLYKRKGWGIALRGIYQALKNWRYLRY